MAIENPWLMPQGIEDVLPEEAFQLETLRRSLLDLYQSWGYQQVMPPFIEFIDSLLADLGKDLDLKTFKITDQLSGKMMGVRADMTPQVARMDAHILGKESPVRLCYIGTVLHTRNDEFAASRSPLQLGCELFGHAGIASDIEVISLMMETLHKSGIESVTLDIGNVGVFRGLMRKCGLAKSQEAELFEVLQRKSVPDFNKWIIEQNIAHQDAQMLTALIELNGDETTIEKAKSLLAAAGKEVIDALDYTQETVDELKRNMPDISIHIDFSELHGYHYKTGLVFAAYSNVSGQEIARGGRYDEIGKAYGRARPATGFSADLKVLSRMGDIAPVSQYGILAPNLTEQNLAKKIDELRQQGEIVVVDLSQSSYAAQEMNCDRVLIEQNGQWQVVEA